jgi:capsid protein
MKRLLLLSPLLLTACTVNPVQVAADAAFCSSAESILTNLQQGYETQVVDSEFLASSADFLSGLTEPLSNQLGDDINSLLDQLSSSAPVSETRESVDQLLADISIRCSEVGVEF